MNELPSGTEITHPPNSFMRRLMHGMARLMPENERGENVRAVAMMRRMFAVRDAFAGETRTRLIRRLKRQSVWPVMAGAYRVGDPHGTIAICTLTSNDLPEALAKLPAVAIAGRLYTPNLGIEKIILNITANPAIRFLLLCGKESVVFRPGQAVQSLCEAGITADHRIIGAVGHFPVLTNISAERIQAFRQQIELIDCTDETSLEVIETRVKELAEHHAMPYAGNNEHSTADFPTPAHELESATAAKFVRLKPGGHRQQLQYDPKGFYVITLDARVGDIVVRHYLPDNSPAHEMRGRSAEAILLGLLREDLISQMSHAGYIGYELAKAETALRLGLHYEQDQALRDRSA